jgi:hypothetical protein
MQSKMLKSLGLKGYLMTDGRSPVNLFDTAHGLVQQTEGAAGGQMFGGMSGMGGMSGLGGMF